MTDILILRCQPGKTRKLIREINDEHGEGTIWSPMLTRTVRLPRKRATAKVRRPALPGYLFIQTHNQELVPLLRRAGVSPLWVGTGYAYCAMQDLLLLRNAVDGVQTALATANDPDACPVFPIGTEVAVLGSHDLFGGLEGVVISQENDICTIKTNAIFGRLQISGFLLQAARL